MRPRGSSALLKQVKAPAFLVSSLINIRYLTGVEVSAGLLLITPRRRRLYVDARYTEAAAERAYNSITVVPAEQWKKDAVTLTECAIEADDVTVSRLASWKSLKKNTKFVQSSGVVEEFRRSKDTDEIQLFRKAQAITQKILNRVEKALKASITEKELAWKLREWAQELGAEDLSFDPIVAFGTHSSRPHHHPTDAKLGKRSVVQIDVGAKYGGYCADKSRVLFMGEPTAEQAKIYQAVKEAKHAAEKMIRIGVSTHSLDVAARDVLRMRNLEQYFTHSLGHGVGLEIHEGISLSSRAPDTKLLKGEIVTIEPGVYLPGKFGIRLEDEVIVGLD